MATWGPTQISTSADDADEDGGGGFRSSITELVVWSYTNPSSANYHCGGLRWPSVSIPQGATILSTTLSLYIEYTGYDDLRCKIYGNNVDNAQNFSDNPHIISTEDRPRTTDYVSWTGDSLGIGWEDAPDVKAPIQEIINRAGWTSGNALVLLLIADVVAAKMCNFYSYEYGDHDLGAKLSITYEEAPPAKKTLVQATLISIPPLIVLPTLAQILKFAGGY